MASASQKAFLNVIYFPRWSSCLVMVVANRTLVFQSMGQAVIHQIAMMKAQRMLVFACRISTCCLFVALFALVASSQKCDVGLKFQGRGGQSALEFQPSQLSPGMGIPYNSRQAPVECLQ